MRQERTARKVYRRSVDINIKLCKQAVRLGRAASPEPCAGAPRHRVEHARRASRGAISGHLAGRQAPGSGGARAGPGAASAQHSYRAPESRGGGQCGQGCSLVPETRKSYFCENLIRFFCPYSQPSTEKRGKIIILTKGPGIAVHYERPVSAVRNGSQSWAPCQQLV